MSVFVKSFSVGEGDMYTILDREQGGNLTVIDCCISADRESEILSELRQDGPSFRFISTHPDEDHIRGLAKLKDDIRVLWACNNGIDEMFPSEDMKVYRQLFNSEFTITAGSSIAYKKKGIGIDFLWPKEDSVEFKNAVARAKETKKAYNNTSPILIYTYKGCASFMWMGDLSSDYLSSISKLVAWRHVDVLFAPHHGRDRVPLEILGKLTPRLIVIGEAASDDIVYYDKYCEVCQNTAQDILFECDERKIHLFSSGPVSDKVRRSLVQDGSRTRYTQYKGTVSI